MAIILEGFDNSGKSSLADRLGFPVLHAGGPPANDIELRACLDKQLSDCKPGVTFDRVSCISDQVYGGKMFHEMHKWYLKRMLDQPATIVIYCRPPDEFLKDFSGHIRKSHDSDQHIEDIEANMALYIKRYDDLMITIPHVKYDYVINGTDPRFIRTIINSQVRYD